MQGERCLLYSHVGLQRGAVCMYVCICQFMYICVYVLLNTCMKVYTHGGRYNLHSDTVCIRICTYTGIVGFITFITLQSKMYIYIIHAYIYIYIYIYIHTHTQWAHGIQSWFRPFKDMCKYPYNYACIISIQVRMHAYIHHICAHYHKISCRHTFALKCDKATIRNYSVCDTQDEVFETDVKHGTTHATWEEDFMWEINQDSNFLIITVLDRVSYMSLLHIIVYWIIGDGVLQPGTASFVALLSDAARTCACIRWIYF